MMVNSVRIAYFCLGLGLMFSMSLFAEPWVDTRDALLRADIELLSDIGLINQPMTTYPMMWSGIIKDIDNLETKNIPFEYRDVFWRVKKKARKAISVNAVQELRTSLSNTRQVLRSFGDESRGKGELAARRYAMSKNFAWNIEIARVYHPVDGDKNRFDGSYLAGIYGNWLLSAGAIERWWGPGWNSSNILSNNARPPLGISLQRNYSEQSAVPVISWLGPWTYNMFVAHLDDKRTIKNARLAGATFSFKPFQSLEMSLRMTSLWGGDKKTESFDSLVETVVAKKSCDIEDIENAPVACDEYQRDSGDRIAGIDARWRLPVGYPVSIYASSFGNSDSKLIPSENMKQFGLTSSVYLLNTHWKWYLELVDTTLDGQYNQAFESSEYLSGHRYNGRAIGSTYDNDSAATVFGVQGYLNKHSKLSMTLSKIELNQDSTNLSDESQHSITENKEAFNRYQLSWDYETEDRGTLKLTLDYADKTFDDYGRRTDKLRATFDWKYYLD